MDTLTIEVEAAPGIPEKEYESISGEVVQQLKSRTGVTCRAVVLAPGAVPRSEGKAVRVRDVR